MAVDENLISSSDDSTVVNGEAATTSPSKANPSSASTAAPNTPVNGEAPQTPSVVVASSSEAAEEMEEKGFQPPPNTQACPSRMSPTGELEDEKEDESFAKVADESGQTDGLPLATKDPRIFHRRLSDAIETLQVTSEALKARSDEPNNKLEDDEVAALSDVASVLQEAASRMMSPDPTFEDPMRAEARQAASAFLTMVTNAAIAAHAAKSAGDKLQAVVDGTAGVGAAVDAAEDAAAALLLSAEVAGAVTVAAKEITAAKGDVLTSTCNSPQNTIEGL